MMKFLTMCPLLLALTVVACNGGNGGDLQTPLPGLKAGDLCIYTDPSNIKMKGKIFDADSGASTVCMPNDPAELVQ